jgi:protein-tyrosine phosphatase
MENTVSIVDFHTHILPGVDDGAQSMEDALELIVRGVRDGIDTFVLTPHIRDESELARLPRLRERFVELRDHCRRRKIPAELVLGAEVAIFPTLAEAAGEGIQFSVGGRERYVLFELPFTQMPLYADAVVHGLLVRDITPLLAHPERCRYLHGNMGRILKWIDQGLKLQINTGSLNGRYGLRAKWFAKRLVKKKLAHCFGSDAHNLSDYHISFRETMRSALK